MRILRQLTSSSNRLFLLLFCLLPPFSYIACTLESARRLGAKPRTPSRGSSAAGRPSRWPSGAELRAVPVLPSRAGVAKGRRGAAVKGGGAGAKRLALDGEHDGPRHRSARQASTGTTLGARAGPPARPSFQRRCLGLLLRGCVYADRRPDGTRPACGARQSQVPRPGSVRPPHLAAQSGFPWGRSAAPGPSTGADTCPCRCVDRGEPCTATVGCGCGGSA